MPIQPGRRLGPHGCGTTNVPELELDGRLAFAGDAAAADRGIPARIGKQRTDLRLRLRVDGRLENEVRHLSVVADGDDQRDVRAERVELLAYVGIQNRRRLLGAERKVSAGWTRVLTGHVAHLRRSRRDRCGRAVRRGLAGLRDCG